MYVTNSANDYGTTVSEFAPGSTTPTATLTGLNGPSGLAVDGNGDLYVANGGIAYFNGRTIAYTGTTVSKFAPGSMMPSATLTGLSEPIGLTFDDSGNLYVSNINDTVSKFTPTSSICEPTAGGVVIRSSQESNPMSVGGTNNAVAGVSLTDAELAQIFTTSTGTVTVGDNAQTGSITFTTATVATTPGASTWWCRPPAARGRSSSTTAPVPARRSTATAATSSSMPAPAALHRWPPTTTRPRSPAPAPR